MQIMLTFVCRFQYSTIQSEHLGVYKLIVIFNVYNKMT